MAEIIIYRPVDVHAWLKLGSDSLRKAPMQSSDDLRRKVTGAVGKAFDFGKGALADMGGLAIDRIEYRLHTDHIEVVGVGPTKSVPYSAIRRIEVHGRGYRVEAGSQSFTIKPYAHLLVSSVKVPLGWKRNRMDVAFHLLADEIAARAKVSFEEAG
ncbi:MAG: hypothetical protein M3R13_08320 [Armatimonadota bacterium]|nr:hypothetical protein [Armatimonadota bacterium]